MVGRLIFIWTVVIAFIYIASPFLLPLAMGAVFASLFSPFYRKLVASKLPALLAASLITLAFTFLVLLPMAMMIYLAARSGIEQLSNWQDQPNASAMLVLDLNQWLDHLLQSGPFKSLMSYLNQWVSVDTTEFIRTLQELMKKMGTKVAEGLGDFASHLPTRAMELAVIIVSVFFFLLDGERILKFVRDYSVFGPRQTERLIFAFGNMCRSVVVAVVLSGMIQSTVFSLVALFAGISNISFVGFSVFLASFIPLIGTTLITFPIALFQFFEGDIAIGIVLLIAGVFVTTLDNFIRPWVLKGAGNLHPLLAFIAAFGGLKMFGFSGIFLGPIIAGLFVVTLRIVLNIEDPATSR